MVSVRDRIQTVVVDKLGVSVEEVTPEASFTDDLNADSLDLVELIMAFEEEFSTDDNQIEITDEDAEKITTVQLAMEFLIQRGVTE